MIAGRSKVAFQRRSEYHSSGGFLFTCHISHMTRGSKSRGEPQTPLPLPLPPRRPINLEEAIFCQRSIVISFHRNYNSGPLVDFSLFLYTNKICNAKYTLTYILILTLVLMPWGVQQSKLPQSHYSQHMKKTQ